MDDDNNEHNAEKLSGIISGILKNRGWESKVREHRVFPIWNKVVGDDIAKNSAPSRIDRGLLVVVTKNPTWTQQLTMMKKKIIDKINVELDDEIVKDIRFIQGKIPPPKKTGVAPKKPKEDGLESSPEIDQKEISELTKDIKDEELKEILENIIRKAHSRYFQSGDK